MKGIDTPKKWSKQNEDLTIFLKKVYMSGSRPPKNGQILFEFLTTLTIL
jgi:hypothetical protein